MQRSLCVFIILGLVIGVGSGVGGILKAAQGSFAITGENNRTSSEHYSYDDPAVFKKRIRVKGLNNASHHHAK